MVDIPAPQTGPRASSADNYSVYRRLIRGLRSALRGSSVRQHEDGKPQVGHEALLSARPDLPPPGPDVIVRRW